MSKEVIISFKILICIGTFQSLGLQEWVLCTAHVSSPTGSLTTYYIILHNITWYILIQTCTVNGSSIIHYGILHLLQFNNVLTYHNIKNTSTCILYGQSYLIHHPGCKIIIIQHDCIPGMQSCFLHSGWWINRFQIKWDWLYVCSTCTC